MKKIKKIICLILCTAFFLTPVNVQAKKEKDYWPKLSEKITANAALLMDVDTGTILYEKNVDKRYYPASITKILTTLIAIENSTMDEIVTFSEDSIYKTEGSRIGRDVGEKMTMEECLYAIMLESSNESAYAVAEHVGGSLSKFVKMMNKKAKELGCTSSHFSNPHGLPEEDHYVTARDMAIISREAYQNETFRLICGTKRYVIPETNKHSVKTYLSNHHLMLYPKDTAAYLYDYCTGGKTGYTIAAGNTLVTYAQKDGMTLLVVVLSATSPEYWIETRALFDFGFDNFKLCNVSEYSQSTDTDQEKITKYDTLNANEPYAKIDPQSKIMIPKTVEFSMTDVKFNYNNLPKDVLAQLDYMYGKHMVGTANIIRTNTTISQPKSQGADLSESQPKQDEGKSTTSDLSKSDNGKFSLIEKIKNFRIDSLSIEALVAIGIFLVIIVIFILYKVIFNKSYVLRQKIARRRREKKSNKQYVIIKDNIRRRGRRH